MTVSVALNRLESGREEEIPPDTRELLDAMIEGIRRGQSVASIQTQNRRNSGQHVNRKQFTLLRALLNEKNL